MSWIEVESKIHVRSIAKLRAKIRKVASYKGIQNKIDDYYALAGHYPKKSLRIRRKDKSVEVNFKKWISYKDGVHAKKETEFSVSDVRGLLDLLNDFGFHKWMEKRKKTELYKTKDGVSIELNYVKDLGWFVEIEYLCSDKEIRKARRRVISLRKQLGLKDKDVVKEGYTQQLWKKKRI